MNDTVTISKKEYLELLNDQQFLQLLQRYGVDNWEGYEMAQEEYEEEE